MSADPRDQRIAELEQLLRAALARIAELEQEVRELKARLNQNSNNSSKPPSSDGPGVNRSPKKPPTGRKPGGQPGHEKSARPLLPVEEVDHVVPLVPDQCGKCHGRRLRRSKNAPWRHQQVELPKPKAEVTEYQGHTVGCLDCGATTTAELPPEAASVFGIRLSALASSLMVQWDFAE